MKKLLIVLFALPAFAAVQNTQKLEIEQPVQRGQISVGPAVALLGGELGLGGDLNAMFRVSQSTPFYLGVQTGAYIWSASVSGTSASVTSIPVLASMLYKIETGQKSVTPYLGLGLGTNLLIASASSSSRTASVVAFQALIRPGVEIPVGSNIAIQIEPKVGFINTAFTFMPHIGATFGF